MTREQAIAPKRKKPHQKRALVTLEAIRIATLQVLERDGVEKFRTTRVAERAGVSVGTLYQYYRNREELLQAVIRAELGASFSLIENQLTQVTERERARAVVQAILAAFSRVAGNRPVLLDLLLSRGHQVEVTAQVQEFLRHLSGQIENRTELSREAAFVLTRAVLGVVRSILLEPSELSLACLEEQLVLLIRAYAAAARRESSRS